MINPTVVERKIIDPTAVDREMINPTVVERTTIDLTAVERTMIDPTAVERKMIDPTAVGRKMITNPITIMTMRFTIHLPAIMTTTTIVHTIVMIMINNLLTMMTNLTRLVAIEMMPIRYPTLVG